MATILDPRFKKNGLECNSNAEQASAIFENELVNMSVKENPVNLNPATKIKQSEHIIWFLAIT